VYIPFESQLLAAQTLFSALRCTDGDENIAICYSSFAPRRGVVHHETRLRLVWGRQFRPVLYTLDNRKTDVLGGNYFTSRYFVYVIS
jgi:hypothetical protein